jgi:hypothetical protein
MMGNHQMKKQIIIATTLVLASVSGVCAQDATASVDASTPVPVRSVCGSGSESVAQIAACWSANGSSSAQLGASEGGSGDSGGEGGSSGGSGAAGGAVQ